MDRVDSTYPSAHDEVRQIGSGVLPSPMTALPDFPGPGQVLSLWVLQGYLHTLS